jgi:hypothetical protein
MGLPESAHAMPPREINVLWRLLYFNPLINQIPLEKEVEREHQILGRGI